MSAHGSEVSNEWLQPDQPIALGMSPAAGVADGAAV